MHPSQGETSSSALSASQKHHFAIWYFASWNVRTLGRSHQRGEGVALVLRGPAIIAWRDGGSQWKAWGSRIISATLDCGERLHVFSCYAPTFAASRDEKDEFLNSLQDALSTVLANEVYVILGHLNTRVGSRTKDDESWYERGPFCYGVK